MPPPIWKKPIELLRRRRAIPLGERHHRLDAALHACATFLTLPEMQCAAKMLPSVESSQPGTKIGRFFSHGREQPAVGRVDLVELLELAAANQTR